MNYKVEKSEKNKASIVVTLDKQEWQKELDAAYNKYKSKYSIVGFRAGKAPRKVIEKTYGDNVFFEEALSDSFYKYYFEILSKETDLQPLDSPSLTILEVSQEKLVVEAELDLQPEVTVSKYKGFGVSVEPKKVTEKDVKVEVDKLLEQNVRFVESKDAVKQGNIVNIDFSGSINGKKFDGGTSQGYDLEIGSHSFIDTFEDQLVGLKENDEKDVVVTFPKEYHAKDLAGKEAVFHVKVNTIKVKEYPTLDDEFISNVTEFEKLDEFKADLKKQLEHEAKHAAELELETKILEKVLENTKVELPESMIEHEVEHMLQDFEMRLMYQGLTLDGYLNYLNITMEQFKKERRADAEKNVKVGLALQHILQKEGMELTEKEVDAKIEEMAKLAKKPLEEYRKTVDDHRLGHIRNDILMSKLMEFLLKNN